MKAQATLSAYKAPAKAEHISLTTETPALPAIPANVRVRIAFELRSALRGCATEVAILEEHYLSVRSRRGGMPPLKYVFDLRFASPKPVRVRHVAWSWMAAAMLLTLATGAAAWSAAHATAAWTSPAFLGAGAGIIGVGIAVFFAVRHTSESLQFLSVHGGAPLVSITGGIGSGKAGKRFFIEMIKSINLAKAARPQPPHHFLRDEMREHHRLHEMSVLTDAQYADSRDRILRAY